MNHNDATAAGFAAFNQGNHVTVEVPDGQTTYSFRTSDGKRLTVCFLPTKSVDAAPGCVDVAYFGTEDDPTKDWRGHQAFEMLIFSNYKTPYDSRQTSHPANIATILLEDLKER